ncbi:hypothetical protein AABB24_027589 [Solanum stoloniferum]|uniref:Uncharacterized protein n=1 Tax=Solanum stoloniferum TaxID=62892 RepID=A0ABD2S2V3_9SOLN
MMEMQKRKTIDDDSAAIDNKKVKITKEDEENNQETIVDDDEVEEFFAILKRIRVAMKYFDEKAKIVDGDSCGGKKLMAAEKPRNPALLPEDFEGQECVEDNGS